MKRDEFQEHWVLTAQDEDSGQLLSLKGTRLVESELTISRPAKPGDCSLEDGRVIFNCALTKKHSALRVLSLLNKNN